ncbi:TPA: GhoT/OrtT family toxin [Escherichia coli]
MHFCHLLSWPMSFPVALLFSLF